MIAQALQYGAEAGLTALVFIGSVLLVHLAIQAVRMAYRAIHKN